METEAKKKDQEQENQTDKPNREWIPLAIGAIVLLLCAATLFVGSIFISSPLFENLYAQRVWYEEGAYVRKIPSRIVPSLALAWHKVPKTEDGCVTSCIQLTQFNRTVCTYESEANGYRSLTIFPITRDKWFALAGKSNARQTEILFKDANIDTVDMQTGDILHLGVENRWQVYLRFDAPWLDGPNWSIAVPSRNLPPPVLSYLSCR